jgi:hypothetical protein
MAYAEKRAARSPERPRFVRHVVDNLCQHLVDELAHHLVIEGKLPRVDFP